MKCFGNSSTTSPDVASVSTNNQQLNLPYSSSFLIQHVNSRHLRSRGTCATAGGSWTWRAWGTWTWRAEGSGRCPCLTEGNRLHCVHDSWIMDQAIKINALGEICNGAKKVITHAIFLIVHQKTSWSRWYSRTLAEVLWKWQKWRHNLSGCCFRFHQKPTAKLALFIFIPDSTCQFQTPEK